MERNKLLLASYLDIIFDGRNKLYGGYELRSKYGDRARKATLGVILGVTLAATIPLVADALTDNTPVARPIIVETKLQDVILPKEEILPPTHEIEPPRQVETISDPEVLVVPDDQPTDNPPTIDDIEGKQVALTTTDGPPGTADIIPSGPNGKGKGLVEHPQPPTDQIHVIVEIMPAFEGDLEKYLQMNLRYPEVAQQTGIEGTVGVQFVVLEDGSISSVEVVRKVAPSLDAEAIRVISAMPKWKPGRQQGKAVKVYFKLPIRFVIE
jgi:protein TonB